MRELQARELPARSRTLICLVLFVGTCALFWQVGGHEFVTYDDPAYVTDNPYVTSGLTLRGTAWAFSTTYAGNWHPLTWLSHMLDVQLFGLDARCHHLVNVLFHATNAILLFVLLIQMTGANGPSAFVAAVFAIHPLRVESVAWIAERKDVLSGMFWLLTLMLYSQYSARPGRARYTLTLLVFALGLMVKPTLVTLPAVLLLLDFWPLRRLLSGGDEAIPTEGIQARPAPLGGRALVAEKIRFFLLAFALSVITFLAQQSAGAVVEIAGTPAAFRVINAASAYVGYIGKTIWPMDLAVIYPLPATLTAAQGPMAGALLVGVSVAAGLMRRGQPYFAVGWLWYLTTLLPVIGLVQVGKQSMADRYHIHPADRPSHRDRLGCVGQCSQRRRPALRVARSGRCGDAGVCDTDVAPAEPLEELREPLSPRHARSPREPRSAHRFRRPPGGRGPSRRGHVAVCGGTASLARR
jgi:hypothetical protein